MARALDLIDLVAAGGPSTVSELAVASGIPAPTTHRLLRTMVECGYARQLRDRRYALGFRLVSLGLAANAQVGASAHDVLADLVEELGETANLAVLSGNRAEYVAQVPSRHAMRMFIEVGRRVELHCTGVGKALLAQLDDRAVSVIVARSGMPRHTAKTVSTQARLLAELADIRRDGYATDDEEQEAGVRCVAVPVSDTMAVSISGPVTRLTPAVVERSSPPAANRGPAADRRLGPGRGPRGYTTS